VIAHRLSTIRNCDRILVMDQGNIVGDGSYEELLVSCPLFEELVKRQMLDAAE
jgi:ABC-type multidrug transport system fused ATPase/permease subunit